MKVIYFSKKSLNYFNNVNLFLLQGKLFKHCFYYLRLTKCIYTLLYETLYPSQTEM